MAITLFLLSKQNIKHHYKFFCNSATTTKRKCISYNRTNHWVVQSSSSAKSVPLTSMEKAKLKIKSKDLYSWHPLSRALKGYKKLFEIANIRVIG